MIRIQILGAGCAKCKQLSANAAQAARELGLEHVVEKVTEISEIMAFGIMTTPGLVIDGCPVACGRKTLERIGVASTAVVLTEMGLVKGQTPVTETAVAGMAKQIQQNTAAR
jgi:small redox-active disulfide protein 2